MDKELLKEINAVYYRLEMKQAEITHALFHRIFELESGWYNGHYHKGEDGNWFRESYPIPVIGIKGICDIEIQFEKISISTKLKRDMALAYSFEKFSGYEFAAFCRLASLSTKMISSQNTFNRCTDLLPSEVVITSSSNVCTSIGKIISV